jgi:starch-binding outer membrane protein, SusD/RagB family
MLAYYHLFTRKFDSVAYYANLAWTAATGGNPDKVLYDYNTFVYTDPANPLTSAIKSPDNQFHLATNKEMLFYRATDNGVGRTSNSYPSDEFIALFDQANDLRYKYFLLSAPGYKTTFNNVAYDDGPRVQYYRSASFTGSSSPKNQMTSGFTYPELLLMRAEGYARTNKLAEAIADLNLLRRYRYKTGTPALTVGTQDQVINAVLDERRRELPLGHIKRFMDLKRLVLDAGKPWAKTKVTHKLGAETFEANIDSKAFVLPIPNTVLIFNPQWGIPLDTRTF